MNSKDAKLKNIPITKLCLKQISKGKFNQTLETSMGFQLWSSTMATDQPSKGDLKYTKGLYKIMYGKKNRSRKSLGQRGV